MTDQDNNQNPAETKNEYNEYGVRWTQWNRAGTVRTIKERIFSTAKARDAFAAKVEKSDNFNAFESWLN